MKRSFILAVLAVSALAAGVASAVDFNASANWFKGVLYAGTSRIQLTNAAGNLSTTTGTYSGGVGVGGTLGVTGAATIQSTLAVVGATAVSGALGVTGAVTLKNESLLLTSVSADGTASTTSAQGTVGASGLVSSLVTHAATVGTNGDSYTLPDAAVGAVYMVCNAAAANNMDVFPFTSDSINKESANTAINLLAGECALCVKVSAVKWGCVIGVAN